MGNGTFQAKYIPLSMVDRVESILVIRKSKGPSISRVKYYELPTLCKNFLFNHLITPFILLRKARNKKTDLILSYHFVPHAYFAYIASLLSGKDFIFAQTGGDIQEKFRKPFWRFVIKMVYKRAKYILVPGKQARDFWIKHIPVKDKIHVLHSTIDIDVFKPNPSIKKDIDILYVGILNERKQVDRIIKAFSLLVKENKTLKLGIVGKGPLEKDLKDLTKKLELVSNVEFFGFQNDVTSFLERSRIFIMASQMEGLPVALMEAMASGLLCIAPARDNIPTVLRTRETGFLMPDSEQITINKTLNEACSKYSSYKHLGDNARLEICNNYSYTYAINKWNELLNNLRNE